MKPTYSITQFFFQPQDTIGIIDEIKDITSILKYICDQIASEMDPTKLSAHLDDYFLPLFRNFWIFMVLVILPTSSSAVYSSSSTSWPKDWPQLLASIATASPALLLQHDKKHLEADILSNSVLSSIKISDQVSSSALSRFEFFFITISFTIRPLQRFDQISQFVFRQRRLKFAFCRLHFLCICLVFIIWKCFALSVNST